MEKNLTLALQVEEWTREAVVQCGDDWEGIAAYIKLRFSEMDESGRAEFATEASLTLRDPSVGCTSFSAH